MPVKHGPPLADSETRIQAFESKCLRKLLRISYLEHKTNGLVRSKISFLLGSQEPLLATVERLKQVRFRHVTRHDSLSKTILRGTLEGEPRRGRRRKCWMDNIREWTSLIMPELLTIATCNTRLEEDLCWIIPHIPPDDPIGRGTDLN